MIGAGSSGDRLAISVQSSVFYMRNQVKISALDEAGIRMWREPPGGGYKAPVIVMLLLAAVLALTTGESTSREQISLLMPRASTFVLSCIVDGPRSGPIRIGRTTCAREMRKRALPREHHERQDSFLNNDDT